MEAVDAKRYHLPALARLYSSLDPLAWPIVRIAAGALLIPHGTVKLFGIGTSVSGLAEGLAQMGFEPAYPLALFVACLEFFGGILLVIGLLTRPIALLVAGFMAVAAFFVHAANGYFWTMAGSSTRSCGCCCRSPSSSAAAARFRSTARSGASSRTRSPGGPPRRDRGGRSPR